MAKVAIIGQESEGYELAIALHGLIHLDPTYTIITADQDVSALIAAMANGSITQAIFQTGLTGIDADTFGAKMAEGETPYEAEDAQGTWAFLHPDTACPKALFRFDAKQVVDPVGLIPAATYNAAITADSNKLKAAWKYFYNDFTVTSTVQYWQNLLDTNDQAAANQVPILQQSDALYLQTLDYGAKALIVEAA